MQKYIDICKSIAVVAGLHRSYNNISRSKPEHLKRLQLNQMQKKNKEGKTIN